VSGAVAASVEPADNLVSNSALSQGAPKTVNVTCVSVDRDTLEPNVDFILGFWKRSERFAGPVAEIRIGD
jgi:hypothetical protein